MSKIGRITEILDGVMRLLLINEMFEGDGEKNFRENYLS